MKKKPKLGRPKLPDGEKKKMVSIRLHPVDLRKIRAIQDARHMTMARAIEHCIFLGYQEVG